MTDTVSTFLSWAGDDRNRSPHTLTRYRAVLTDLTRHGDPATIDRAGVETWWATRYNLAPATRANELACLRAYYRWAIRFGHRDDDPTARLDPPRIPATVPRPIGRADLEHLFTVTADRLDLRRAIALGAYAGLRVSEAAALDWGSIDREARRIYITGKGGKQRVFALSPALLDKLLPVPETGGNVVTAGGRPVSAATLQRRVNRLLAREGVAHTFHDLRKRAATLAIARTGDVYTVAKAMGWASVETASAYALVSDDALDAIASAVV